MKHFFNFDILMSSASHVWGALVLNMAMAASISLATFFLDDAAEPEVEVAGFVLFFFS